MSEIKVVPYIPDEDYDNPAMVVDFYEFTMANCLFLNGFKDTTLVFDMFFRKNPDNQGYSISAGQRKLTRFLLNYHFNEQDVHWLRTKGMSEEFCEYLRTYRWKGDMYALPEGTVCYPHVQMVRIECDLVGAILIETYLLQTMNFHSLIATKATRITGLNTHTPRSVMEFGTRRAQGESAGNDGAYAAVLGGCIGTANCLAEMKYGSEVKAVGTVAHSFIEFFPTEFDAFKAFADTCPDVITSLEFERLTNAAGPTKGHLERLSDHKAPKSVTFIQCVGSRDTTCRGKSYCSKICCMYTAKHAMLIRDKYPDVQVNVFYIDVRTPGKNFDEFYRRAVEEYGVNYIKGQVGKVAEVDGHLRVQAMGLIDNRRILLDTDMVVLAAAIEPDPSVRKLATMLTASIDTNNFLTEAHPKLRPVESPTAGIFLSGVCQGPKDIPETVSQAGAAAAKVIGLLAKDKLVTNPCTAKPDERYCNGCRSCEKVCPYGAISYETKLIVDHGVKEERIVACVNSALCQGCGACTVACPSGAMDLQGFSNRQLIAEVDAICRSNMRIQK